MSTVTIVGLHDRVSIEDEPRLGGIEESIEPRELTVVAQRHLCPRLSTLTSRSFAMHMDIKEMSCAHQVFNMEARWRAE